MSEKILFPNSKGEELVGRLFRGGMLDKSIVLFSHDANDNNPEIYDEIIQNLSNNNIPYFRFDYSGYGQSQGDSLDFDISKGKGDILSAIALLKQKGYDKILLVGRGMGAIIGLKAALEDKSIGSLCLISAGAKDMDIHEFTSQIKKFDKFVFFIHGNEDAVYSPSISVDLDSNLVNSELLLVEGADNQFSHPRDLRKVVNYVLDYVFKNK